MLRRVPNQRPKTRWWTGLLSAIVVGALVGIYGLVCWIISGFSNWDAVVAVLLGAMIFFGFRKVKSLQKDYGGDGKADNEDTP